MAPQLAKARSRGGTTVVEVIVAVALLGAGLALTGEVLYHTSLLRRENERRQCAQQEAANALERIRGWSWQQLTAESLPEITLSDAAKRQLPQGELTVQIAEDADDSQARRVIVEVAWQLRNGQPASPVRLAAWRWNVAEVRP